MLSQWGQKNKHSYSFVYKWLMAELWINLGSCAAAWPATIICLQCSVILSWCSFSKTVTHGDRSNCKGASIQREAWHLQWRNPVSEERRRRLRYPLDTIYINSSGKLRGSCGFYWDVFSKNVGTLCQREREHIFFNPIFWLQYKGSFDCLEHISIQIWSYSSF